MIDATGLESDLRVHGGLVTEMNNETRRELLAALEALSEDQPEVRIGQLIANISYLARESSAEAIWDAEDDELLAAAHEILHIRGKASGHARES